MYITNKVVTCTDEYKAITSRYAPLFKGYSGYCTINKIVTLSSTLLFGELLREFVTDNRFTSLPIAKYKSFTITNAKYEMSHRIKNIPNLAGYITKDIEHTGCKELVDYIYNYVQDSRKDDRSILRHFKTAVNSVLYKICSYNVEYLKEYIEFLLTDTNIYDKPNIMLLGYVGAYNKEINLQALRVEKWYTSNEPCSNKPIESLKQSGVDLTLIDDTITYLFGKYVKENNVIGLLSLYYIKTLVKTSKGKVTA